MVRHRTSFPLGTRFPICWKRPEGNILGYYDEWTDVALFSIDGKVIVVESQLNEMYILTRNCVGGPSHCPCAVECGYQGRERSVNKTSTTRTTVVLCRRHFTDHPTRRAKRRLEQARSVAHSSKRKKTGRQEIEHLRQESDESDYLDVVSKYKDIPLSPIEEEEEQSETSDQGSIPPRPSPRRQAASTASIVISEVKDSALGVSEINGVPVKDQLRSNVAITTVTTPNQSEFPGNGVSQKAINAMNNVEGECDVMRGAHLLEKLGKITRTATEEEHETQTLVGIAKVRMFCARNMPKGENKEEQENISQTFVAEALDSIGIRVRYDAVLGSTTCRMPENGSTTVMVFFELPAMAAGMLLDELGTRTLDLAEFNESLEVRKRNSSDKIQQAIEEFFKDFCAPASEDPTKHAANST